MRQILCIVVAWKLISNWIATEAKEFVKFVDEKSIGGYISSDRSAGTMDRTTDSEQLLTKN